MGAVDPATYLRSVPPFDALPTAALERAAAALEVAYHPAGARIARAGGPPLEHLHVIRKGAVRLERDGRTVQLLEEGELFGLTSLLSGEATLDVVADEDVVSYRLPADEFHRLLAVPRFAVELASGVAERLRASLEQRQAAAFRAELALEVQRVADRPPRWIDADATVGEAARVMRDEGIGSLLVRGAPPGIVTDRDLRDRVLAEELGPETPVARVASRPLVTVPATTPLYVAWRQLLDPDVHHLALERDGEIAGVVSSGDLLRHAAQTPAAVLRFVETLEAREALPGYAARVREMVAPLVASGLDPTVVAALVARAADALTHRLLRWAEGELGDPPAPYAWLALGSEGRAEQTLVTDQDTALVYGEEGARERGWYEALAARVGADLEAAGFPGCVGGHVARRDHGTLAEWRRRLDACVDEPRAHDVELYFDFRRVGGRLDVAPLEAPIARAGKRGILLHLLAREAVAVHPPAPLALRLRGGASVVDLKRHAMVPLAFLARVAALEAGSCARGTLDRIEAARRAGVVGDETAAHAADAFRFLLALRFRVQLRALDRGAPPSNAVSLGDLTPIERTRLRAALHDVRSWQAAAAERYAVRD